MSFAPATINYPDEVIWDMDGEDLAFRWDRKRTVTVWYGIEQIDVYQLRTETGSAPTQGDFAGTITDWIDHWGQL